MGGTQLLCLLTYLLKGFSLLFPHLLSLSYIFMSLLVLLCPILIFVFITLSPLLACELLSLSNPWLSQEIMFLPASVEA